MPSTPRSRAPRHGSFRTLLDGLRAFIDFETDTAEAVHLASPLAANDNQALDAKTGWVVGRDRRFTDASLRPTEADILNDATDADRSNVGASLRAARASGSPIYEVGGFRFAVDGYEVRQQIGGSQPGWHYYRVGANELLQYRRGNFWVSPTETADEAGAAPRTGSVNSRWASILSADPQRPIKLGRDRRARLPPIDWSTLPAVRGDVPFAEARANAGLLPSPSTARAALPSGPSAARDLFMAGMVGTKGPQRRTDIAGQPLEELIRKQERKMFREQLPEQHAGTLRKLATASTLQDLAPTATGKTAQRRGQKMLLAAATAATDIIKQFARAA